MIDYGRFAERLAAQRANPDPARRWDLYREFHAEWGFRPVREPEALSGYIADLVGEAGTDDPEEDPGIPEALAEWWVLPENSWLYAELDESSAHWPPRWWSPDGGDVRLLAPDSPLAVPGSDDLRTVAFMAEAQYTQEWGYLSAQSTVADPQVLVTEGEEWEPVAPTLSEFALLLAAVRVPAGFGWQAYPGGGEDEIVARVQLHWPPLGLPTWRECGAQLTLYGGPDAVIVVDEGWGDYPFRLCTRTREAAELMIDRLGGSDWSLFEPEQ
ncbi:hypothetical protein GCM10009839_76340 [Catenulispora yoronensis]|uniref:SMI1/KNR4 family protein n=1 Tax=Catenulispora yoronensis TaxID=450799 RepID=A0ABN2VA42_9ACTN